MSALLSNLASGAPRPNNLTVEFVPPNAGQEFQTPATLQLVARTSTDVRKLEFHLTGAKLADDLSAPYSYPLSKLAAGTYEAFATDVDNKGARTNSTATLLATATPSPPGSFSIDSGPTTFNGTNLTLTGAETVTVRALRAGDAAYLAAPDVARIFDVSTNFESWRQSKFTATELADLNVSGPSAVFGQDGIPNLVKYALGLEPKENITTGLPELTILGAEAIFTYSRIANLPDATCTVEIATNLVAPNFSTVGVTHELVSTTSGFQTWRGRYSLASAPTAFFRLKVTQSSDPIVPPERLANWIPNVNVGVPGGIPHRAEVGARVDAATYGNGAVDATAAISAAVDACPPGKVVYIPAGRYRVDGMIYLPNARQITIRGAGVGQTFIMANTPKVFWLGDSDWPRPANGLAIISGANKGSTTVTVADATSVQVGNLVRIEQDDLPYVIASGAPQTNLRSLSATFRVTAKTGTAVAVAPEIPFTFDRNPTLVHYSIPPLISTGIEDLTIDGNGIAGFPIQFQQTWGCWVKGVEILRSVSRQIFLYDSVNGEIRDNYFHDVIGGGPDHEGIDLYQDCSFNLIENNILYNGGFPGITLGDFRGGCTGNVIGYNFVYAANTSDPSFAGADISVSHGPHNTFNLIEGNIAGGLLSDGYFGSTSHTTVLRNWFTATHPTATDNLIAVNLGRWNNYFSLVANVLGSTSFSAAGLYAPETEFGYEQQVIYKLGFPNLGNNYYSLTWGPTMPPDYRMQASNNNPGGLLQELDLNVKSTLLRHGNYDYLTATTKWDPAIANQSIPTSLYYQTQPPWWPADVAFPPIGPDVGPMNGTNPAYKRFKAIGTGWPSP